MSDLNFQDFSTVQNENQPKPNTLDSAVSPLVPTTFVTFVSGTDNVDEITPPVSGQHMLVLIFTNSNPGDLVTGGNIEVGSASIAQNKPVLLFYNPNTASYYPGQLA